MFPGTPLHKLELDGATLSEVLRLHLLSSGAKRLSTQARSDLQQRGGYSSHDNPALDFCQRESKIVDTLRVSSVFQLSPGTKMMILLLLLFLFFRSAAILLALWPSTHSVLWQQFTVFTTVANITRYQLLLIYLPCMDGRLS